MVWPKSFIIFATSCDLSKRLKEYKPVSSFSIYILIFTLTAASTSNSAPQLMSESVPATPIPVAAPGGPTPSPVRPDTGRGGISRSLPSFPLPESPRPGGHTPDTAHRHTYSGCRGHRSDPESYCKSFHPSRIGTEFRTAARSIYYIKICVPLKFFC